MSTSASYAEHLVSNDNGEAEQNAIFHKYKATIELLWFGIQYHSSALHSDHTKPIPQAVMQKSYC